MRRRPNYGVTITPERIERAARIYKSNAAAAEAIGITAQTFYKLCRRYGVDTPQVRRRKAFAQQQAERADNGVMLAAMAQEDEGLLLDVLGQIADR